MLNCFIVGIGGFVGAICRYLVSLIPVNETMTFPIKTLIINVTGAFIIGIIVVAALKNPSLDPRISLLIKIGFCGGFTTFSTFSLEVYNMWNGGKWLLAVLYIILSVVLCVATVAFAEILAGR